jgi:uncharacterized protein YyaL (SSP411 family)
MPRQDDEGIGRFPGAWRFLSIGLLALLCVSCATCGREKGGDVIVRDGARTGAETKKAEGGARANRLSSEKSPYLLQHAHNPVDWYPWGEEAFRKAREEGKPVFLSIGYSTCHWCHVMAHESFEDPEVAALMNETFVNVKVDREERPDIDAHYMSVCQMMTGGGGWPLTIVMTPDKKAFFAGTYFPRETVPGRMGMLDLVPRLQEAWEERRDELNSLAEQILHDVRAAGRGAPGQPPGEEVLKAGYDQLSTRFDERQGGFGPAPKFPSPHHLLFLLRYWKRSGEPRALRMVEETLAAMGRGGIRDHVGFGFHRYATDGAWRVPHFEKMLYDQALLATAYTETYQATGVEAHAEAAHEIFTYVLRDMTSPEGAFYSAEDADSEGEEGKFYVWKREEILDLLGKKEGDLFCLAFGVEGGGNFAEEASGRKTGANILHLARPLDELASSLGLKVGILKERLEAARERLFRERKKRVHPFKDTKVLTDWNGLMIAALAKASVAFERPEYARAAAKAADFLFSSLRTAEGELVHRYRDGEAGLPAHVDDHAFLVWGLIELYEATFEVRYLKEALRLNDTMIRRFWDEKGGGFFFTAEGGEELHARRKEVYDGAVPSGNSVALWNLLRLARLTGNPALEARARELVGAFSRKITGLPMGYTLFLTALDFEFGPLREVVIAGDPAREDGKAMLRAVRGGYRPGMVVLLKPPGEAGKALSALVPFTAEHKPQGGKATAFVCSEFRCELPVTDPEKVLELLDRSGGDGR